MSRVCPNKITQMGLPSCRKPLKVFLIFDRDRSRRRVKALNTHFGKTCDKEALLNGMQCEVFTFIPGEGPRRLPISTAYTV